MIIINIYVSQEPHDFYKPIACLVIKIFMIGNRNQILRLPNGFYNTAVDWGKRVWYNRSLKDFYFFEALLDNFEARFFFRASILHHITDTDTT